MNRRIAIVAALALTLGALPLMAQQGSGGGFGQGQGQGQGQRMGGPGRGRGPGGPGGPMAVLPGLNQVDLTDAQREQVRGIMEQERQSGDPGEKVREAEQALHAAVLADTPNPQAIDAAKGALNAAHVAELDHRVELMQKIVQILTPAQRQELAQWQPPAGRRGGL
jgi:Spy/CpxP family protein refolding chaperone